MHGRASPTSLALLITLLLAVAQPPSAASQDAPPYLLAEPTEYTNVIDAFDGDEDPIDFNVRLSFLRTREDSTIAREQSVVGAHETATIHVADYQSIRSELIVGIDIGLYRDLMVYGRLPLVFSDTRVLRLPEPAKCMPDSVCDWRRMNVRRALAEAPAATPGAAPLFALDPSLESSTRSGVPAVDVGVAWGVTNQYRTPQLPTWVVSAESRIGVGTPMRACVRTASCDPGNSRGTTRLQLASRWSYRYRFIEPFLGVDYAWEWAAAASDAFEPDGVEALGDSGLPSVAGITLGGALVPWEQRGRFQQLSIDLRARAEYVSAGRDYSPLFDALGASENPYLKNENQSGLRFNGLTEVDNHARLSLDLALVMQAARYVRFRLGLLLAHATPHLLNDTAACTEARAASPNPQCGDDAPNALHRAVIDQPGQRFRQTGHLAYTLSATATGQF
jgi:hypothetical protein